jgi:hypothetical protein
VKVALLGLCLLAGLGYRFSQDGVEVARTDGMMGCDVLALDGHFHRVDSRVCLAMRALATGEPTPDPVFQDAGQEVTVRADWYLDRHGNLVVNWGWLETVYEVNDEPLRGASPECRESMREANPDSTVVCLKKRAPKPINEPTPDPFRAIQLFPPALPTKVNP